MLKNTLLLGLLSCLMVFGAAAQLNMAGCGCKNKGKGCTTLADCPCNKGKDKDKTILAGCGCGSGCGCKDKGKNVENDIKICQDSFLVCDCDLEQTAETKKTA